jgi:hypothetical protein
MISFLVLRGIEKNNLLEIKLANLRLVRIQRDNLIDIPPKNHKNLTFK